jgi:hypothetical protein
LRKVKDDANGHSFFFETALKWPGQYGAALHSEANTNP